MKNILFICLSFCIILSKAKAQMGDTTISKHKVDADLLFQKSKNQKKAAWILLAGGAGLTVSGIIIVGSQTTNDLVNIFNPNHSASNTTGGEIMAYTGIGAILGSIPLFVGASKNKKKADFMLKNETVFFNPQLNIKDHLASIGIRIKL